MNYLYHIYRGNLKGKYLMPLNELKKIYPEIYRKQVKKYEWRKHILKKKIPPLNCLWNDVLHMSPVHPKKIKDALNKVDVELEFKKWFKINPNLLDDDLATVFKGSYVKFREKDLKKYGKIEKPTIEYYKKIKKRKIFLLFHSIPSVLYKGKLKISDLEVIEI